MIKISENDKYHEIEISPYHLPFLRDLGIKVVSMIVFDIIYGPVCYMKELSRSNFGDKLKDVSSLSEVYTGFARTNADVITSLEERIVIGRYIVREDDVENIVVLLLVCVPTANLDKLTKHARSLSERAKGKPQLLNEALKLLIESEKTAVQKIPVSSRDGVLTKGITINDASVVRGDEFNNFYGFLFVQYHRAEMDGRFLPKMVDGKKIDLPHLFKFIDTQKNEAELKEGDLISLYYKGLELLVYQHIEKDALLIGAKKPQSRINYSYIDGWFKILFNSYIHIPGNSKKVSTIEAIKFLDKNVSKQPKKYIIDEIMDLIINAEDDYPELSKSKNVLRQQGWITLHKNYQLFLENLDLINGDQSVYGLSQDLSVPVSAVIEFIIFLKSRGFLDVYRKK